MANTRRNQIGGFGMGAATPSLPRLPIQRSTDENWQPSVTRPRVGGVPQADQPTPSPTRPTRRYSAPRAPIPQAPIRVDERAQADAAQRRRILGSGIGNIWDRAENINRQVNPVIRVQDWVDKGVEGIKPTALRKGLQVQIDSYRGLPGKLYLAMDIASVKQSVSEAFNPDQTAERLYNANPQNYSSIEEAKREVQAYNVGEIVGTFAENFAQAGASAFIGWAIRGLLTVGAGVVGVSTGGVGFLAIATIASIVATTIAYDTAVKLTQPENPTARDMAISMPGTYESMIKGQDNGMGAYLEGGPGASLFGNAFTDMLSDGFIKAMNAEPYQNSREEVAQIRQERGAYDKAPELEWSDENGFKITLPMYSDWGRRKNEVHALFSAGYFLKPVMDQEGKPYVQGNGLRLLQVDYPQFIKWMLDTDWLENRSGIATRVMQLPKVDPATIEIMKEAPIQVDEYRVALKWWYDTAAIEYEKKQAQQSSE